MLNFIIPVRHQDNAPDWGELQKTLSSTIRSVCGQVNGAWRAVIVANEGAELPVMPPGFQIHRVDFAPNPQYRRRTASPAGFYEAVRLDKGRRVLAGLQFARPQGHIMILDDDDLVSNRLSSLVAANTDACGWYFDKGYVWRDGGALVYRLDEFYRFCGSSHIVRADQFNIPDPSDPASVEYISSLGSHIHTKDNLSRSGTDLLALPFVGAIYRIGHAGAHSRSPGLFRQFFLNRSGLRRPFHTLAGVSRLARLSPPIRAEFFGQSSSNR